jgi:hypothetical protein
VSNISKAEKNLKKKLSLDDYVQSEQRQEPQGQTHFTDVVVEQHSVITPVVSQKVEPSVCQKIKATYYLSEEDHGALTDVYIKRLQNKQKTDRSALVSEAIRLLYRKEME